jgi:hypothetical protein
MVVSIKSWNIYSIIQCLVHEIWRFGRRFFWQSPMFDIFKSQGAALKLVSFLAAKRGFWAIACQNLKISKIGDYQVIRRAELHIVDTKH